MQPQIATLLCSLLIFYLFWIDRNNNEGVSKAIWIPFIMLLFNCSRPISFWLSYWFGIGSYSEFSYETGNPTEAGFHTILLLLGIIALSKRKIAWGEIFKKNIFIWLYFLFGLASVIWSDFPSIAIKRLIKTSGTIIMALIILTEERPFVALGLMLRRLAIVFLPLSIIFIKYYPELGRSYHIYSGTQWYTGVATDKNGLGAICFFCTIYFVWNFLYDRWSNGKVGQRLNPLIYLFLMPMIAWLFYIVNSATALSCAIVGISILVLARIPAIARMPLSIIFICLGCAILYGILDYVFDVKNTLITMLGRRPDLTTRLPMWEDLLSMVKNPLIGFGYESFWLGERLDYVQSLHGPINQAHNGYIETYLNVGGIGLTLLIIWILVGFKKIATCLSSDYLPAVLRFCFLVVLCLYNYTEATFYGKGIMWLLFLLATVDVSQYNEKIPTEKIKFNEL